MASPLTFAHFDQRFADGMIRAGATGPGLPGLLGMSIDDVGPGWMRASLEVRPDLITHIGNLHGGVLAAFVDHVMGSVLYPVMPRGSWAATTEWKVNYLAPVKEGKLIAESTVLAMTKRTAVVRVEVTNGDRLAALAQGTLLIVEPKA